MTVSLRTSAITVSIRKQHHLPENDIKFSRVISVERVLSILVDADLVFVGLERSGQAKKPAERWQVKIS